MNERIRELAEQAGFYVADNKIYIPTISEEITDCQTKFAELLIEECKNVCTSGTIEKPMGLYYAKQIEKHFGVE